MASFYLRARDRQALWGDNLADEFGSVNGNESERRREWAKTRVDGNEIGPQRGAAAGLCSASTGLAIRSIMNRTQLNIRNQWETGSDGWEI